jgi:hypothetical protein
MNWEERYIRSRRSPELVDITPTQISIDYDQVSVTCPCLRFSSHSKPAIEVVFLQQVEIDGVLHTLRRTILRPCLVQHQRLRV